jgi:hypothetical protein
MLLAKLLIALEFLRNLSIKIQTKTLFLMYVVMVMEAEDERELVTEMGVLQ